MRLNNGLQRALYDYSKELEETGGDYLPIDFKKHKSNVRDLDVYYSKSLNLVLKRPVFILEPRTPLFLRIPTYRVREDWVAQPIARKTDLKKAVEMIELTLKPYRQLGICPDVHVYNVGWHTFDQSNEARPVLFDW